MLLYSKRFIGLFIVLRVRGAAWPYGVIPGLISAGIGLLLSRWSEAQRFITQDEVFTNHYPFQLFAYLVGIVIVFRTNYTYRRYWHAVAAMQVMAARWLEAACLIVACDSPGANDASLPYLAPSAVRGAALAEAATGGAANAVAEAELLDAPPSGPPHSSFFVELVHLFSLLHALALLHLRQDPDLAHLESSPWQEGQWLRLFNSDAELSRPESICRPGSAEELVDADEKLRLKVLGHIPPDELQALLLDGSGHKHPGDVRVSMAISWIMRRLIAREKYEPAGDLSRTSPPIISRIFALLSDGAMEFGRAKHVAEVPFPFPYQNLKQVFLWVYVVAVPVVVNAKATDHILRFTITFIAAWSYFALSQVGDTLEDPYHALDPNGLPLAQQHDSFNVQLLCYGTAPGQPASAAAKGDKVRGVSSSLMSVLESTINTVCESEESYSF